MAVDGDRSGSGKINIGLSVKFEAKALKVIGFSRKTNRYWEFSQSALDLIREYKVTGAKMLNASFFLSTIACVEEISRGHEAS